MGSGGVRLPAIKRVLASLAHQPWCFPSVLFCPVLTCAVLGYRRTKELETVEIPLPFFPAASGPPSLFPVVSGIPYSHKAPEKHKAGAAPGGQQGFGI